MKKGLFKNPVDIGKKIKNLERVCVCVWHLSYDLLL